MEIAITFKLSHEPVYFFCDRVEINGEIQSNSHGLSVESCVLKFCNVRCPWTIKPFAADLTDKNVRNLFAIQGQILEDGSKQTHALIESRYILTMSIDE